jgi:hypothetical protein
MPVSIFAGCTQWCGWPAALLAIFGFGSFGVPIKFASSVDVDPLVMQSYKTWVCFLTCWFVYFLGKFSPTFTDTHCVFILPCVLVFRSCRMLTDHENHFPIIVRRGNSVDALGSGVWNFLGSRYVVVSRT